MMCELYNVNEEKSNNKKSTLLRKQKKIKLNKKTNIV